jgi:hypothetical protein
MSTDKLKELIFDNAVAMTFQSLGQYRTALLAAFDGSSFDLNAPLPIQQEQPCQACGKPLVAGHIHTCSPQVKQEQAGRDDVTDEDILDWIIDNHTGHGGGNGFEIKVWVPVDSEDIRDGIARAIRGEQA